MVLGYIEKYTFLTDLKQNIKFKCSKLNRSVVFFESVNVFLTTIYALKTTLLEM